MAERIAALAPKDREPPTARVRIEARAESYAATITIERATGTEIRTLTSDSCDAVADAAALVIAIGAAPDEPPPTVPLPEPLPPAPTVEPPRSAPIVPQQPDAAPARIPREDLRIGVAADAGIAWRTVPAIGPTIAGSLAVIGERWRVELRGIGTTRTRTRLTAPNDGVVAEVRSGIASVRAAYVPRIPVIELPLHGGISVGATSATARGTTRAQRRTGLLAALEAGVGLAWAPIPRLALRIDVAGILALVRPRFAVSTPEGAAIAFTTPWLGLRALAGIELRIPVGGRSRAKERSR